MAISRHIVFFSILCALTKATPLPQGDDGTANICSGPNVKTDVHMDPAKMNWGNANPWDVVSYLNKPGGPCNEDSCRAGDPNALTTLPTTIVDGQGRKNPETFKITVVEYDFSNGTSQDWIGLAQGALIQNKNVTNAQWYQADGLAAKDGDTSQQPGGMLPQNYATTYIHIERTDGAVPCGHLDIQISVQPPNGQWCTPGDSVLGGLTAAMSYIQPEFAIAAGFFGAIAPLCKVLNP